MKSLAVLFLPLAIITSLVSCHSQQRAFSLPGKNTSTEKNEKMRIAVMDLKADDVSESTARKVSELIRTEMVTIKDFIIVERSQMGKIFKEQGLQQTGCTDQSCAVKAGRMLSAQKIFVGSVIKLGSKIIITGRIVDVEKGTVDFSGKSSSKSLMDLDIACGHLIRDINSNITGNRSHSDTKKISKDAGSYKYANFSRADLQRMQFPKYDLKYANFQGANLQGVNFKKAKLKYANMKNSSLKNADLRKADLKYANLRGADLTGANIKDTQMEYTNLTRTKIEKKWRLYITKNCKNYRNVNWVD